MRAATIFMALIMSQMVLGGCAQQPPIQHSESGALAWPSPPQPAKIVFVKEIRSPRDIGIGRGVFGSLAQALRGSEARDISQPYGIAVTRHGELLVVDNAYNAVHRLDMEKGKYSSFPKRPLVNFRNPVNIALGADDRIYISDSMSGLVHVFSNRGAHYLGNIGGDLLQRPTGLVVNRVTSELLVVDTKLSQIAVFDEATLTFKRIVGTSNTTDNSAPSFHYPTNITATSHGKVYVADSLNFRIQVLDSNLELVTEFGKPGNAPGQFSRPKGLATDSDGHVYVIDALFDNIQVFEPDGSLLIAIGSPGKNAGEFWMPNSIWIDEHDRIYVSDAFNQRVQVFQYIKNKVNQ